MLFTEYSSLLRLERTPSILEREFLATPTDFLGLSMSVVLQLAEEGVLLGQQHFNVLHTHSDYSGANVRLKSVDTLVGDRRDVFGESRVFPL